MKKQFATPMIASLVLILSACHNVSIDGAGTTSVAGSSDSSNLPVSTPTPSPSVAPTATPAAVDLSSTQLIYNWSVNESNFSGSLNIGADASLTTTTTLNGGGASCTESGYISANTPSADACAGGAATCGTFTFELTQNDSSTNCQAPGTYQCSYVVTASVAGFPISAPATLIMDCGVGAVHFNGGSVAPSASPTPSASPSPSPSPSPSSSPSPSPSPSPAFSLSGTGVVGSWSYDDHGTTDTLTIANDGSFSTSIPHVCTESGAVTAYTSSGNSGTFALTISSTSGRYCLPSGDHSCSYSYTLASSQRDSHSHKTVTIPATVTLSCDKSAPITFSAPSSSSGF